MKRSNRAIVLTFIRQHEPVSRREIARRLSLSPTTASAAVADLIERGLVREIGRGESTGGRRPILLEVNPDGGVVISVDVSSTLGDRVVRAAALDLKSKVLLEIKRQEPISGNQAMLDLIQGVIAELVSSPQVDLSQPLAVGLAVPGLVNTQKGELVYTHTNVQNLPLGPVLQKALKAPVFVQNSEDAAALGEYHFGAGRDDNRFRTIGNHRMVYLSAGAGIGAGLVVDGQVCPSGGLSAGEVGHMTLQPDGPLCVCGNRGCLSALVNSEGMVGAVRAALEDGYQPSTETLAGRPPGEIDVGVVMEAAEAGEKFCQGLVEEAAGWLGIAVATIINLFNPELIVVGGELFEQGDNFLSLVEENARRRTLKNYPVRLLNSTLGRSAGLKGASILAMEELFKMSRQA